MAAKKNERYPLRIQGYGSAGGAAWLEGQAVFVKGPSRGSCMIHLLKAGKPPPGKVDQGAGALPGCQVPDCPRYPQWGASCGT